MYLSAQIVKAHKPNSTFWSTLLVCFYFQDLKSNFTNEMLFSSSTNHVHNAFFVFTRKGIFLGTTPVFHVPSISPLGVALRNKWSKQQKMPYKQYCIPHQYLRPATNQPSSMLLLPQLWSLCFSIINVCLSMWSNILLAMFFCFLWRSKFLLICGSIY